MSDDIKNRTREELLYLAKLAEQCDRFDEMVQYVTAFCKASGDELTVEERNILSVAFKNVVGTRRAAWRVISLIERKETKKGAVQKMGFSGNIESVWGINAKKLRLKS